MSKHLVTLSFSLWKNDVLPRRLSTYGELVLSWFGLYLSAVTWKYDYLLQMSVEMWETGKIEWFKILSHFAFVFHFALYRLNA